MFLLLFSVYIFTLVFTFLGWVCIQKHVFQIYYLIKKMNLNDGFIHSYFKVFCSTLFLYVWTGLPFTSAHQQRVSSPYTKHRSMLMLAFFSEHHFVLRSKWHGRMSKQFENVSNGFSGATSRCCFNFACQMNTDHTVLCEA